MTIKVFNLCCANGHMFEGWFSSNEDFLRQKSDGMIACPSCGSTEVEKRPNASHIGRAKPTRSEMKQLRSVYERLMKTVREEAGRAEDVGERFVDESRNIAAGISENRLIKGKCTAKEAQELWQEGIPVLPVPESSGKTLN